MDPKKTANGPVVMEINDIPKFEHGIEDEAEKTEIWDRLTEWFLSRIRS